LNQNYRLPLLVLVLLAFFTSITAQTYRGSVRGTVYDPNRAAVPGAEIKLISTETNQTRTVESDAEGNYTISELRPGAYKLEVTKDGFQKQIIGFTVAVNQA
jgi:uncharacterized surface anchored protein